ncbi:MAG: NAD-dependent dihydropyrimidine dehydrogenase subunit PreA [Theionarchaea archaeon]|nr:NAD-dependent dihydropyrimidine dehydrogenase subunit PreA [Theionarchaea archaeon]
MTVDLSIEFCGLEFDNPIWLSSAPPTMSGDHIKRAIEKGWGGAVVKTLGLDKDIFPDVRPRLKANRESGTLFAMENIELITTHYLDWWEKELKVAKSTGAPLIVSIMAAPNREDWATIATWAQDHGADMVELNVSCPHGCPEKARGAAIGQDPDLVAEVTTYVKEAIDIPVMIKVTPNVTDIVEVTAPAVNNNVDAISGINTVFGLIGVDIYEAKPHPNVLGYSTYGGNCGPAVRPIGLRIISQLNKAFPDTPLSGIGGIDSWENVLEYIMLGATSVQVCTAAMWYGFDIISGWLRHIETFFKEQGYSSFEDFRGMANRSIGTFDALKVDDSIVPEIDVEKCISCMKCYISCRDGASNAIKEPKLGDIDQDACVGCSLCVQVCPMNAITMVKKS